MPVGRAVAGWFTAAGDALLLSKPVLVRKGETVHARPRKPTKGGDVLAVIERQSEPACRPVVQLITTNEVLAPDAFVESSRRVFADVASASDCPPAGYTLECNAFCGWCDWPGPGHNCCRGEYYEAVWYCLLTVDLYGCHDGTDDPCCEGASLF